MLGERLKKARLALNLTQIEFSKRIDLRPNYISKYERDESQMKIETLEKISKEFNININWLLTGDGEMFLTNSKSIEKIINGNNNNINIIDGKVKNSFNNNDVEIEESILKDIVSKLKNVHDSKLLNYIDNEITTLLQRIQVKKEYGSTFGG